MKKSAMYQVFVWVPTKGWKHIRSFSTLNGAVDCAEEFEPLEVKVVCPTTGDTYYGGRFCTVNYTIPMSRSLPSFPAEGVK